MVSNIYSKVKVKMDINSLFLEPLSARYIHKHFIDPGLLLKIAFWRPQNMTSKYT
jgi:hypothetical protein